MVLGHYIFILYTLIVRDKKISDLPHIGQVRVTDENEDPKWEYPESIFDGREFNWQLADEAGQWTPYTFGDMKKDLIKDIELQVKKKSISILWGLFKFEWDE